MYINKIYNWNQQAVAKFMEKVRGNRVRFDPDRIVMSGGATGAHETLAFCLADPGEAFLVPTPYYPGYFKNSHLNFLLLLCFIVFLFSES
jgi:aspartate/methionine/tyrosine aminotransferase